VGKLSLPGPLLRLRGPNMFDHRRREVQSWRSPLHTPTSMCLTSHFLLISFPVPEQKGEQGTEKRGERNREEENWRKYQDPEGVAPPSFLSHG
jgi:hypothetical protein